MSIRRRGRGPGHLSRWPKGAGTLTYEQLLEQVVLDNDFENGSFYWNGSVRALGDLTANGDGSYDLAYGSWFTGEGTVLVDYENAEGAVVSGEYFSWVVGTSQRVEFGAAVQTGGVGYAPRLYVSPSGTFFNGQIQYPGQSATVEMRGGHRSIYAVKASTPPKLLHDNWSLLPQTVSVGALTAPTKLTFGRNARFGNNLLTNATLKRVIIWNRILTDAEMAVLGRGPNKPVHLIGDSFLNLHRMKGALDYLLRDDAYTPVSQDGVGGTSLTQQAVRFALNSVTVSTTVHDISKWKNSTLIIMDGGLDGTAAAAIAAIDDMAARLPDARWLWMEPAPNEASGTPNRITWDANVATIAAYVGSRFVPTLAPALAAGNGSAEDNADIAEGVWPLSLKTSDADFHPSLAGHTLLAQLAYNKLDAMGWLP